MQFNTPLFPLKEDGERHLVVCMQFTAFCDGDKNNTFRKK